MPSDPRHFSPEPQSLRALAGERVSEYRSLHPATIESYRQLDAAEAIERLMSIHGALWIEDLVQQLSTARRLRGEK